MKELSHQLLLVQLYLCLSQVRSINGIVDKTKLQLFICCMLTNFFLHVYTHVGLPRPVNVHISNMTNASLTVNWNYPPPPIGTIIRYFLVIHTSFSLTVCISYMFVLAT